MPLGHVESGLRSGRLAAGAVRRRPRRARAARAAV